MKTLKTVQEVIDEFGGVKHLAHWADVGESAVCNWSARGYIPPGWCFRLQHYFTPKNRILAPSVFGQDLQSVPFKRHAEAQV